MKKVILFTVLAVFLWLLWRFFSPSVNAGLGKEGAKGSTPSVSVLVIDTQLFSWKMQAVGSILPNEQVALQTEALGKVMEIFFTEGSLVSKGQLLVKLNDAEEQAQLKKLTATAQFLEKEYQRKKDLLEVGGVSREEHDQILNELENAQAEKNVLIAQIGKKQILAPFSGRIGLRYVSEGAYISQATRIATLIQTSPVKIEFSIPEKYGNYLKPGSEIAVQPGDLDSVIKSRVYAVEPGIDEDTRSLKARGLIENEEGKIIPGTYARIELVLGEYPQAVLVPSHTLVPEINGLTAWVVKKGKAEKRIVKAGAYTADEIQVLEGLIRGDTLITTGLLMVREGMIVNPIIQER